jgi:YgiT-type zinc finger domain-containing protein
MDRGFQEQKGEALVKCVACKAGTVKPGTSTFMADMDGTVFVVRGVPALVCDNCGEKYFEGPVLERLMETASGARQSGVKVDIRDYMAA